MCTLCSDPCTVSRGFHGCWMPRAQCPCIDSSCGAPHELTTRALVSWPFAGPWSRSYETCRGQTTRSPLRLTRRAHPRPIAARRHPAAPRTAPPATGRWCRRWRRSAAGAQVGCHVTGGGKQLQSGDARQGSVCMLRFTSAVSTASGCDMVPVASHAGAQHRASARRPALNRRSASMALGTLHLSSPAER
jgi:hypothetical protein